MDLCSQASSDSVLSTGDGLSACSETLGTRVVSSRHELLAPLELVVIALVQEPSPRYPVLKKCICCQCIGIWPPAEVMWALGGKSGRKQVHVQGPIRVVDFLEYQRVQLSSIYLDSVSATVHCCNVNIPFQGITSIDLLLWCCRFSAGSTLQSWPSQRF